MIHRAYSIPLSDVDFKKELFTMKSIADNNDFKETIINNLISKKEQKLAYGSIYHTIINKLTIKGRKICISHICAYFDLFVHKLSISK